jgi:transcriptional regulator with GAF, ATPase, and Fis domain
VILSPDNVFCVDSSWLPSIPCSQRTHREKHAHDTSGDDDAQYERDIIESALAQSRGRIAGPRGAAVRLGLSPSALDARIKKLKIRKNRFKLG